jgi:hypothetical protein
MFLIGTPKEKKPLGRTRRRSKNIIGLYQKMRWVWTGFSGLRIGTVNLICYVSVTVS